MSKIRGARRRGTGDTAEPLTIGLVDPDPYLSLVVRREYPDADVFALFDRSEPPEAARGCDVILVEIGGANADRAFEVADGTPLVGVGRLEVRDHEVGSSFDAMVVRPYLPHDLRKVIDEVVGRPEPQRGERSTLTRRLRNWMGPARIAAIALAAIIGTTQPSPSVFETVALTGGFVYATARLRLLRGSRIGAWLDAAVAVALIAATGGYLSSYLAFGFVAALTAGLFLTAGVALLAGTLLSMSAVPSLVVSVLSDGSARPFDILVVLVLFPAAALVTNQARRLSPEEDDASIVLLREANRALASLYEIARDLPRSLTMQSVAQAVLDEVEESVSSHTSVLLVLESGVIYEVASHGLTAHQQLLVDREELPADLLPARLTPGVDEHVPESLLEAAPGDLRWSVVPLRLAAGTSGWVLVGTGESLQAGDRRVLQRLARESALAIDNARLFSRVRDLAIDEERARLASELHDGVAQALAHVRLELEFLSRYGPDDPEQWSEDAERLVQVVQRSLADVRSTIADLRAASLVGGLAVAIHDHCRDIRLLAGPHIEVRTRTSTRLAPDVESELFRIFRAAVSNAVRHADTERVSVLLEEADDELHLVVEDDGRSVPPRYDRRAGREGAGLRSMQDRAERLGASLDVSRRREGGTRVVLTYPTGDIDRHAGTAI